MDIRSEIGADESHEDVSDTAGQNKTPNVQIETEAPQVKSRTYQFRMRHFFYIHLVIFIAAGLLGGLMIYLIENYSALENQRMIVSYVNAWFVSSTCVCSCGLTTLDFAKLSKASQIILLVLTFFCGNTISTLPALAIKAYTHKDIEGMTVDTDHGKEVQNFEGSRQNSTSRMVNQRLPFELEQKFALLPTPQQIRYWAYITIIVLILATCATVYLCFFITLGWWLDSRYFDNQLTQDNSTVNPWYASIVIVLTGFNQNGLTPFSNGMTRFVNDIYVNIFVIMVVLSGTTLFPFLLRNIVLISHRLAPWRYKIVFDYILLNHHHLCTLLFPTLHTRIYLSVTLFFYMMAVSISLILDFHNSYLAQFAPNIRILIFVFHSVNARFAGFQTIDISHFAIATLIIYLLMMGTEPQMLCDISRARFELTGIFLRANQNEREEEQLQEDSSIQDSVGKTPVLRRQTHSATFDTPFAERQVNVDLYRHRLGTKELVPNTRRFSGNEHKHRYVSHMYFCLVLLKFAQTLFKSTMYTLERPYTWLFIFIFLICAIENEQIIDDPNITFFKVIFEIISAFGGVGLSLGYPGVTSSFSTVLSPVSRVIVGLTMLLGRHRGLLASMKDQEEIEPNAIDLLEKWKEEELRQYGLSVKESVDH